MPRYTRRQIVRGAGAAGLALLAGCGLPFGPSASVSKVPAIGWLASGARETLSPPPAGENFAIDAFREGLRELGHAEGRTYTFIPRISDRGDERMRQFAAELVSLPVDIIVVGPALGARAREATATIPIVLSGGPDPVLTGLVASYARPGGNITGVPATPSGPFVAKVLEFLKEVSPTVSRVGVLFDANLPQVPRALPEATLRALGLDLYPLGVVSADELESILDEALAAGMNGLLVVQTPLFGPTAPRIVDFALRHQLPSIGFFRNYADAGGLMTYGPNLPAINRRAAYFVDRILKGAQPADLPIEQPMTFDFVINLRTAQALGFTIPQHVLLQATEVLQ